MNCGKCGAKTQLNLCTTCQHDLQDMLNGLHTRTNADGKPMPGWLQHLHEAATGQTRLGHSERRSGDKTQPMPCNLTASQLLQEANGLLYAWDSRLTHPTTSPTTS